MPTHYRVRIEITEYKNEKAQEGNRSNNYKETPAVHRELKLTDTEFAGDTLSPQIAKAVSVLNLISDEIAETEKFGDKLV